MAEEQAAAAAFQEQWQRKAVAQQLSSHSALLPAAQPTPCVSDAEHPNGTEAGLSRETINVTIQGAQEGESVERDPHHPEAPYMSFRHKKESRSFHCCLRIGNSYLICGKQNSCFPQQLFIGPDWYCMLFTYMLILGGSTLFAVYVLSSLGWKYTIVPVITFTLTLLFYSLCACSDPGVVFREETLTAGTSYTVCSACQLARPNKASHCYDCGVCINELDHHCPWTGKCIGQKTLRYFYCFVTFLFLHIIYVAAITVYYVTH